jgi:cytoskeletal protein RodZ
MNKQYKSQMQNIKFSPDFNEKTIKMLQEFRNSEGLSVEVKSQKEHPNIITIVKAVSLSLAACLLCVFTVTLIMEQSESENIPEVTNIKYTYDVNKTETEPEIVEDLEDYTPFATPDITGSPDTELFKIAPVYDQTEANGEYPAGAAVPETTVKEPAITTITEPAITTMTVKETEQQAAPAEDSPAEAAADEGEEAIEAPVDNDTAEDSEEDAVEDDEITESEGEDFEDSGNVIMDDNSIEDPFTADFVDVKYNAGTLKIIQNSIKDMTVKAASLTYNGGLQGEIAPQDAENLMEDAIAPFLTASDTNLITLLHNNLEFVLVFSEPDNTSYTICLYSDAISIKIDQNGSFGLTAISLQSKEHNEIFKSMYLSLFSQTEYELYLAMESGK